jgi:transglutaminase-like putative cysteine protease
LTDKDVILSNPITYKVTRTVTIRNTGAQIDLVRVWLSLAVAWDSQTNVTTDATTPASTSTWQDSQSGNKVLFWELRGQPASGSSITLTDEFTYTCHQISCEVDPNRIGTYNKTSSDYQFYTRSEKYIESDNAQIKEISGRLQQDKTNPYAVAGAIYDWVMNSLTYRTVGGLKGAKFALDNKYGECGDYSALFVALCRAAGIPARPVVGRWATSSPADWHVWAEFYLPGYGWLPVDPTDADLNGKGRANFGNLDNKRLILHKGFNITLQPKPIFLEPETGILQTLTWEWRGTGGQVQTELTYTINQK